MKRNILFFAFLCLLFTAFAQETGLKVGDKAADFKLKNIDDKTISLKDYKKDKGVVLIFTCNHCPFAALYPQRLILIFERRVICLRFFNSQVILAKSKAVNSFY